MKGLNVKRIVALGLGAALVGSALAPAVMAGVFSNVDTLQKGNVIDSTGTPVVDIVVGSMGQAADVVWAGNIAAKVAQLATIDATAAAPTVDFTIGGSTVTTGDGELVDDITVVSPSTSLALTVDNGDSSVLIDESDWKYDINGDEESTAVEETLTSRATAGLQTEGDGVLAGQLVANVDVNQLEYKITFNPGIPNFTKNDDVDLSISFLGKTWDVRSIAADKVELRSAELSEKLFVGDSVKVTGIGAYAGKELDLVLTEVAAAQDNASSYLAEFELRDGTTVIDVLSNAEEDTDIQDEFEDYFSTPVSVNTVYRQIDTSSGYVRLDTGDQALDLEDGEELKEDGNNDAEKWIVDLDENATHLTSISVYNSADFTYQISDADSEDIQGEDEDAYRMGPMAVNTSVDIADAGKYKFSFLGLTTEEMFGGKIADGVLTLSIDNKMQEIPLSFGGSSGFVENSAKKVTVLGEEYTLYYDADANTLKTFHNISDNTDEDEDAGDISNIDFGNPVAGEFYDNFLIQFTEGDIDVNYQVVMYWNDFDEVTYILGLDALNNALGVDNGAMVSLDFNGTYVDTNLVGAESLMTYYLPADMPDDIFDNWFDGNKILESDSQDNYSALFTIQDGAGVPIIVRVDTKTGNLIDTDEDYAGVSASDPQAEFGTVDLDASTEDELVAAGTPFGTEVSVIDNEFVWSIPETRRYAQIYLGATDTTESTTGGAKYTGVAVSETEGNVTINAINGTAGKTVVKVGNIVKLDTDAVSGKSIIVGGQLVNNMAKTLQVSGQTLEERLVASGDYVAAVLDNGSIVVAGWTANDTAVAARALIAQLEAFM